MVDRVAATLRNMADSGPQGFHGGPDDWRPFARAAVEAVRDELAHPRNRALGSSLAVDLICEELGVTAYREDGGQICYPPFPVIGEKE
jgi:hypothetical protein